MNTRTDPATLKRALDEHIATQRNTLRDQIIGHLAAHGEATADEITRAIGLTNTPSKVTNELNAMRCDAIIESERKGKTGAHHYWLSVPAEQAAGTPSSIVPRPTTSYDDYPPGIHPGTRKAQIWKALANGEKLSASDLCTKVGCAKGALDPALAELYRAGTLWREHPTPTSAYVYFRGSGGTPHQSPNTVVSAPAAGGDTDSEGGETDISREEMPPADPALLASANRMLSERLAGVAHVLRGSGLPALEDIDEGEDLQPHVAALAGEYQMARSEFHACEQIIDRASALCASSGYNNFCLSDRVAGITDELSRLRHRLSAVDAELDATVEALAHVVSNGSDIDPADMDLSELVDEAGKQMNDLRQQLEALQRESMKGATLLSGQDRYTPAGYVMLASKRKPRRTMGAEKAIAAATSAVKGGAQRADVFALVPIGRAVKGAEWRPL